MTGFWNFFRSLMGVITGLVILGLALAGIWAYDAITDWLRGFGQAGDEILNQVQYVNYPGGRFFFPALGVFFIIWAVALALKRSWARIAGIALYALGVVYLFALAILLIPFIDTQFFRDFRWWILAIWLVLVFIFGYQVYSLIAGKGTEQSFAAQYIDQPIVKKCDRCGTPLDGRGRCPKCEPVSQLREPVPRKPQEPRPQSAKASMHERPIARLVSESNEYVMQQPYLTVGRDPENDIVLRERSVSGRHAEIRYQQGQFAIRDLGSTNGTIVNGSKVGQSRLESGAKIQFGRLEFKFEILKTA